MLCKAHIYKNSWPGIHMSHQVQSSTPKIQTPSLQSFRLAPLKAATHPAVKSAHISAHYIGSLSVSTANPPAVHGCLCVMQLPSLAKVAAPWWLWRLQPLFPAGCGHQLPDGGCGDTAPAARELLLRALPPRRDPRFGEDPPSGLAAQAPDGVSARSHECQSGTVTVASGTDMAAPQRCARRSAVLPACRG
jgi:hypothetical protein